MANIMSFLTNLIGIPLGWIFYACVTIVKDYGLSIIFFTLISKLILFPVSFMVQKNSVKLVRLRPELNRLEAKYLYDRDAFYDEQIKLYKREKYSVFAGFIPLFLQIFMVIGLINVIYNPMYHIMRVDNETINAFTEVTKEILETDELGSSPQLKTIALIKDGKGLDKYSAIVAKGDITTNNIIKKVNDLNMKFLGIDLAAMPNVLKPSLLWIIPILAGVSAFVMCYEQNKVNVLQKEQGFLGKWGITIFLVLFSLYFGFAVACGVGLYWIFSNVFSIGQMFLNNAIYSPKKHIDYIALEESKEELRLAKEALHVKKTKLFDNSPEHKKAVADYKRFFAVPDNDMRLVFYSEASGFYKYFKPTIDEILANSTLIVHYVTSDIDDAVFAIEHERFKAYYIDEAKLISLMMKITADMVIMTMPDLQTYHIKRSLVRKDVEYVYVSHGGTSMNLTLRTGAIDHFDTIFVVSEEQAKEVRAMEALRQTKKKGILKCGYPLLDNMITSYEENLENSSEENAVWTVLIAPSWQEDNILDSCLDPILESLLEKDIRVVVRPHPQYIRRFADRMNAILVKYQDKMSDMFVIETDFSSNKTVYSADLMITDWSGISTEYSFTTLKPTLFINTEMKIVNPDYDQIDLVPYDITLRDIIGKSISKEESEKIYEIIKTILSEKEHYRKIIQDERERYYYNLGNSATVASNYISKRLDY